LEFFPWGGILPRSAERIMLRYLPFFLFAFFPGMVSFSPFSETMRALGYGFLSPFFRLHLWKELSRRHARS